MEDLAHLLGREHVQLEFLLFKLLQVQHLLRSGDPRFLRWSAEEIKRASQRVHDIEIARGKRVYLLGREAGIPVDRITLTSLAEQVPEPWRTIYLDHGLGFGRLEHEVIVAVREAGDLAAASGHAIVDMLRHLHHPAHSELVPRQVSLDNPMVLP